MEMDLIDGKFKRKLTKAERQQQKYDTFEKHCKSESIEKLKAEPYAVIYAKRVRELNEQRIKSKEKEDAATRIFKE